MKPFSLILFIYIVSLSPSGPLRAQTSLTAGDIAIIGYNYDASPQEMSIVTLAPISAGTRIFIADYGYESGGFVANTLANNSEGSIEWVTSGNIAAGTVFRIQMASSNAGTTVTGLPGTLTIRGWAQVFSANAVSGTNTPSAAGGESWFIYQGTAYDTPTQFVFGWANWASITFGSANGWVVPPQTVGSNIQVSHLPAQLTNGSTAISLSWTVANGGNHGDNNVYAGTRSGTKSEILAAIGSVANWLTNETTTYDITPGGTNFSGAAPEFAVTGSVLPVLWGALQATASAQHIQLTWTTLTEENNSYFTIEHSTNGLGWTDLYQVPARGTDGAGASYEYLHLSPSAGMNYYRIRQTDLNGNFTYSRTVRAVLSGGDRVRLYPNPGKGPFFIERKEEGTALVSIIDPSGRVVHRQSIYNSREMLNLAQLPAGYYILRVVSDQGVTTSISFQKE